LQDGLQIFLFGFLHLKTVGIPLLLLSLIGTWMILRERREWLALPLWTWCYALAYSLAAGPMHPWYYVPFYAGYIALLFAGLIVLCGRVDWVPVRIAISVIAISIVLITSYLRIGSLEREQPGSAALNKAAGEWVNQNTDGNAVFAVKDIGYLGYYSK